MFLVMIHLICQKSMLNATGNWKHVMMCLPMNSDGWLLEQPLIPPTLACVTHVYIYILPCLWSQLKIIHIFGVQCAKLETSKV